MFELIHRVTGQVVQFTEDQIAWFLSVVEDPAEWLERNGVIDADTDANILAGADAPAAADDDLGAVAEVAAPVPDADPAVGTASAAHEGDASDAGPAAIHPETYGVDNG